MPDIPSLPELADQVTSLQSQVAALQVRQWWLLYMTLKYAIRHDTALAAAILNLLTQTEKDAMQATMRN